MTDLAALAPSRLAPGRFRLDPAATSVRFATRHLFGLAPVRGRLTVLSGVADVRDPVSDSLVLVELDAASFTSGNPHRDRAVRGRRYLDADSYPTLTFAGDHLDGDVLSGTLTVRNVTRPVELRVTRLDRDGDAVVVNAAARIDRYAFGITASRGMAARHLRISVRARLVTE